MFTISNTMYSNVHWCLDVRRLALSQRIDCCILSLRSECYMYRLILFYGLHTCYREVIIGSKCTAVCVRCTQRIQLGNSTNKTDWMYVGNSILLPAHIQVSPRTARMMGWYPKIPRAGTYRQQVNITMDHPYSHHNIS